MTQHKTSFLVTIDTDVPAEEADVKMMFTAIRFGLEMAKANGHLTDDETQTLATGYKISPAKVTATEAQA